MAVKIIRKLFCNFEKIRILLKKTTNKGIRGSSLRSLGSLSWIFDPEGASIVGGAHMHTEYAACEILKTETVLNVRLWMLISTLYQMLV